MTYSVLQLGVAAVAIIALILSRSGPPAIRLQMAMASWPLFSVFLLLDIPHYLEIHDHILLGMILATVPLSLVLVMWELRANEYGGDNALIWLRGAVTWSIVPYLLFSQIPVVQVFLIESVAHQTAWMATFSGSDSLVAGTPLVELANGSGMVAWSEYPGSKWWVDRELGDAGFYVPMLDAATGQTVGINIILGCTAVQSMIVFVGAIMALDECSPNIKGRALLMTIPVIHVLNIFRNAGIIHLTLHHDAFSFIGFDIFHFAHAYAAKVLALGAMFLMAIALFDIAPSMHRHILRLIDVVSDVVRGRGLNVDQGLRASTTQ